MIPVLANTDEDRAFGSRVAKTMGLDQIDFEGEYCLEKTGAKNKSPFFPDKGIERHGKPIIVSDGEYIWILIHSAFGWFKTSPIVSFKKDGNKFLIETENSFYTMTLA